MNVRRRAAFLGAGYISSFHAAALRRLPGVDLAGVYDLDAQRCARTASALGVRAFRSLQEVWNDGIDVIHVLTPPETHAELTLAALGAGAHVLVEKPLATDARDCERIALAAQRSNRNVCVDHSLLYDPQIRRAFHDVRAGAIGRLVSVDILRSAEYPPYEGGPLPPQYRSAGYPFRDLGVHQLYLLAAFLGPIEDVRADWRSLGGDPNLAFDEWHAHVQCREGTGEVQISFNVRPLQNIITLRGSAGVIRIDQMSMYSTKRVYLPGPKAIERVINAYSESFQTLVRVPRSTVGFLTKRLRQYHGLQDLVRAFYAALESGDPMPVPVEDAAPIVDWTERIARSADEAGAARWNGVKLTREAPTVVTGAGGALGTAVLRRLRSEGVAVRAFVRSNAAHAIPPDVELSVGDLGDPAAVDEAIRGARAVVHIGAATKGNWTTQRTATVVGTQNVIDACVKHGVEQLIHISSLSVVHWAEREAAAITESSALEPRPEVRGAYTRAKLEAELLVQAAVRERGLRAVILRPGQIFGDKLPLVNAAVARKVGRWYIVLGSGKLHLPLVYIEDVVDGICAAMRKGLNAGQIVQLVDTRLPTQNEILERMLGRNAKVVRIPRPAVFGAGWFTEVALRLVKRSSPLSRYRLKSALASRTYVSEHAQSILEWSPRVGVYAGMDAEHAANAR